MQGFFREVERDRERKRESVGKIVRERERVKKIDTERERERN